MSPRMPIIKRYRNVGIHDFQDRERIETVVRPAIDLVYQMRGAAELYEYATDRRNPPEARLLARAKVEAIHELRATEHGKPRRYRSRHAQGGDVHAGQPDVDVVGILWRRADGAAAIYI
jgi:hypothetical protein